MLFPHPLGPKRPKVLFLSKVKPSVPYIQAGKFLEEGECKTEWSLVNIGV